MATPRPKSCPFDKCDRGYPIDSTIKTERDHNRLYHFDEPIHVGLMGVNFTFRRDRSRRHKYVCMCGVDTPSSSYIQSHVKGTPSKSPCAFICTQAVNIVTKNMTCDDNTQPITYQPVNSTSNQEDADVAIMSEIEEEEEEEDALLHANVSPDENVLSEYGFQVDHDMNLDDSNANLRRILEDQHLLLGNTISQLQDTQNQLQDAQNQLQGARAVIESLLQNKQ
ncbi:MAG: hypothetical protein JOS17DRAFT_808658 [Linnemannia elongata]|nr:MAG: hypothetical protein JOS17DRAFT_808658 [Linnemannia elongata]